MVIAFFWTPTLFFTYCLVMLIFRNILTPQIDILLLLVLSDNPADADPHFTKSGAC